MFIAGRIIIGLGTGIVAVAAPQLMTEVAYPTHRGKMVSLYMTQWVVVSAHSPFVVDISNRHSSATRLTCFYPPGLSCCCLDYVRHVQDELLLELEAS
jgi:MFS family permease